MCVFACHPHGCASAAAEHAHLDWLRVPEWWLRLRCDPSTLDASGDVPPALTSLHTAVNDVLSSKPAARVFERLFHEHGLQNTGDSSSISSSSINSNNFGIGVDFQSPSTNTAMALSASTGISSDTQQLLRPLPLLAVATEQVALCPSNCPPADFYPGIGREDDDPSDKRRLKRALQPLKHVPGISASEVTIGRVPVALPPFATGERSAAVAIDAMLRLTAAASEVVEQAACAVRNIQFRRMHAVDSVAQALFVDETEGRYFGCPWLLFLSVVLVGCHVLVGISHCASCCTCTLALQPQTQASCVASCCTARCRVQLAEVSGAFGVPSTVLAVWLAVGDACCW